MSSDTGGGTQNGGVIAAASLSIVSILGFVGTVLMNHKDIILEKLKCWVGWGAQPAEDERVTELEARPSAALPTCITLPITINNHSGEMTLTANPHHNRRHHHRSQSDPTYETSDSYHESSSSTEHLSSSSSDVITRRVSLDIV